MIVDMVRGDIFKSPYKHIIFGINTEGYNDSGFAGIVSSMKETPTGPEVWQDLASCGPKPLGTVLSKEIRGRTFHGIVCHSLEEGGWEKTPETLEKALDQSIRVADGETVAIVLVGGGPVGAMGGADIFANLSAMARAKRRVAVYTL